MMTREIMQRKKKCTVTLENGRMPEKMAGWNSCSSWSTHKTLFHMRRLITIILLAGCVWFAVILHLFLSIRVSLESCRSVWENSSFVVLYLAPWIRFLRPFYLPQGITYWMTFPLKPHIWMSAEKNTTRMRKILTRCFSLNDARTDWNALE